MNEYVLNKAEIIMSYQQNEQKMKELTDWTRDTYAELQNEIINLQNSLEKAIRKEENLHAIISTKLDEISMLKQKINEKLPTNNGFKISES